MTKTFHGAGLVVPVDKNDVGYRELPETDGNVFPVEICACMYISMGKAFSCVEK